MRIAVCDDEVHMRSQIINAFNSYMKTQGEEYSIVEFSSAEEFLSNNDPFDILFLDIEMEGMTGIELKEELEFRRETILIVFITSHVEIMPKAFGLNVVGFLAKPLEEEELNKILKRIVNISHSSQPVEVEENGKVITLQSKDIIYIKSDHVYSMIVTNDKEYLLRRSLTEMEEELEGVGFLRIHASYLVNPQHIIRLDTTVILENGEKVPMSRRKKTELKNKYYEYMRKLSRYL